MSTTMAQSVEIPATRRYLPALLLLFVGSGCAALIYEIVWFQLLEFVIGASSVSLAVLLGTFMGGMCLGSLLLPRYINKSAHPLRVYAFLELGIAAFGLVLLFLVPSLVSGIYSLISVSGVGSIVIRSLIAAVCLLPPTLLMGATLPAIARWVEATPKGVSWMGFFYGGNIAGAVIGSLLTGYVLLRLLDMYWATFIAILINIGVALLALSLAKVAPHESRVAAGSADAAKPSGVWEVYLVIALSGMTALASEVIWTRLLALLFGATVYAFALILAVFLAGLGIGSSIGSSLAAKLQRPRLALGWCQMLLCAAMAWSAYQMMTVMWSMPINPTLEIVTTDVSGPFITFQLDMMRALWSVLPASILWGASFPLALAAVASKGQDPARLVGGVYAANTVGAIVGSLTGGLLLVAWLGTHSALMVLMVISALAGLFAAVPVLFDNAKGQQSGTGFQLAHVGLLILGAGVAGILASNVPGYACPSPENPLTSEQQLKTHGKCMPARFVGYGRFTASRGTENKWIYLGEGINAFVAVSEMTDGTRNYHNAGKVQASSHPADMRLQRMLGHFTTLAPANQENQDFLVIGFGAGVTAGAVSIGPRVGSVTIAEIEPLVPKVVGDHFGAHNYDVAKNKKVHVEIDDGRHFLFTTDKKFDGITSDPLDPWVKGAAALYTEEFFEMAKQRLKPGGVVTQFVQLYESTEEAVKSEIGTFFKVFPNAIIWANNIDGRGYDLVMFGQAEPTKIDVDQWTARLESPEYAQLAKSLQEIRINNAVDLLSTFGGFKSDLDPWMGDPDAPSSPGRPFFQVNRDKNLRLEKLAGLGLNLYQAEPIMANMTKALKFPENLFTGSPFRIDQLRQNIKPSY
jgi:spermidine synthase